MHTENIRQVFMHLFQGLFQYNIEQAEETDLILNPNPDGTLILNILSRYNFYDIKKAYKNLKLLSERDIFTPYTFRTKKYLANILPILLKGCYSSSRPDRALNNFEYFTGKLGAKTIFYESLKSSPNMISILTNIFGTSIYLSDILMQNPEFRDLIVKILGTILTGINFFMHKNMQRTMKALTQLALFILENIFYTNWENSQLKGKISLCILSLGKLGRKELNFDSDLDIIFCYEIHQDHINSNESMEIHYMVCEWIKKFLQDMQKIYKVDLRLRPMGNSGELAIPLSRFLEYFQKQARTWEKIAFLKASFGGGDKKTAEKLITGIRKIIFASLSNEKLLYDIIEIKNLIEKNTKDSANDFKHGIGGLMEIEFIIDYIVLKSGMEKYFLSGTGTTNSLKILKELKIKKLITSKDYNILKNAYIFLMHIEMTLRLNMTGEKTYILSNDPEWITLAARQMGYNTVEQFISQYKKNSACVRDIFDKLNIQVDRLKAEDF
ncbi:hypothetical protein HY745_09660 [Candidatus Desantisbacteria bacterium]|nr:hypothetical protein [Candidatus Desantisbacteria bacterium]